MVPGMFERERLAADARRIEWLADAMVGPAHLPYTPARSATPTTARGTFLLGLLRRGLVLALAFAPRARAMRLELIASPFDRVTAR